MDYLRQRAAARAAMARNAASVCRYPNAPGCDVDGVPCPSCPMVIRIVGERKRRESEPLIARHFIVAALLIASIALLGAWSIAAVQTRHYLHELQMAERV